MTVIAGLSKDPPTLETGGDRKDEKDVERRGECGERDFRFRSETNPRCRSAYLSKPLMVFCSGNSESKSHS